MSSDSMSKRFTTPLSRRSVIGAGAIAAGAAISGHRISFAQTTGGGVDASVWTPEYITSIAGTREVDTAAEVAAITPLDYAGETSYWWAGPTEASPQFEKDMAAAHFEAWRETYPNIPLVDGESLQNINYGDLLDRTRTAALGSAAPAVAKLAILWASEFAARGQLQEIDLESFGYTSDQFWPGALKSVTYNDKLWGIPTNNETMAFIWNKSIFEAAGLDPETPPANWDEVRAFSRQIKEETGKAGYGLVARVNHGNTPFRFMPLMWAYGGGALDESEDSPTYQTIMVNNDGAKEALQLAYDIYVTDESAPISALTNTQTENGDLFIAGEVAMMISHPSEYASMRDKAANATGADKEFADQVVDSMAYGLIPEGPVRRAVVFGGSNICIFTDQAHGSPVDLDAARALVAFTTSPEWSTKLAWLGSNPGNLHGFETSWMKERLETIPFLDVTTSMLPYGIPFPVIPQANQIMNEIIPTMIQNALTNTMSVSDAADNAASEIEFVMTGL